MFIYFLGLVIDQIAFTSSEIINEKAAGINQRSVINKSVQSAIAIFSKQK